MIVDSGAPHIGSVYTNDRATRKLVAIGQSGIADDLALDTDYRRLAVRYSSGDQSILAYGGFEPLRLL